MQNRVRLARLVTIIMGVAVMMSLVPRGGWLIVPVGLAMVTVVLLGGIRLERRRRPELWVFITTVLNIQVTMAVMAIVYGGPKTALPCLLAAPVLMVGARFSGRGLLVGTPISLALVFAVTLGVDPGYVMHHPGSVVVPAGMVVITAAYLFPLVASDVRHRVDSTLDALTGLLNRRGLDLRLAEVAEQARFNGQPVSVVAMDIDFLKDVNDRFGHASGDLALREIGHILRSSLRSFELLYRVGGDEFLLLLPGASAEQARLIAETLRKAVANARPLGIDLTCSFGLATSSEGCDGRALSAQADAALYCAKEHGRNCVKGDRAPVVVQAA